MSLKELMKLNDLEMVDGKTVDELVDEVIEFKENCNESEKEKYNDEVLSLGHSRKFCEQIGVRYWDLADEEHTPDEVGKEISRYLGSLRLKYHAMQKVRTGEYRFPVDDADHRICLMPVW